MNPEIIGTDLMIPDTPCCTKNIPENIGQSDQQYSRILSGSVIDTLKLATRIIRSDPRLLVTMGRIVSFQKKASTKRHLNELSGLQVPAVIMFSLTHRCNLNCRGCYMHAQNRQTSPDLTLDQIRSLVRQSVDLGVSFFVLAGGEPLVRVDEILILAHEYPDMIFAVYTNGTLITPDIADAISAYKNLVLIISIEGNQKETDARRSNGVFGSIIQSFSLLKNLGVFFGCSVTLTQNNYATVTDDSFISRMLNYGCRIITYVEYVPVQQDTEDLVLTVLQREELVRLIACFSDRYPALFFGFPGDEIRFGGFLSAGRGFVHISSSGDLEPCPAAPFSDANVTCMPLSDALKSGFLAKIRANHGMLSEADGGCALWKNRDWTLSLLGK
jgi:MoaA/NifB/PqqE/SkfB family radical SAM enzyme